MSYLAQPTSTIDYGVVKVGSNISVLDGVISLFQSLEPNANVVFNSVTAGNVTSNGNLVVTSVTPNAGVGIALSNVITTGQSPTFTIQNTGVVHLNAGNAISLNSNIGNITITNTGVTHLNQGNGIILSGNTGNVTISTTIGSHFLNVTGVTTSYTATYTDEYIGVYSAAAVTITLPAGIDGRVYYIKDEYGQGSGKITIQPQVGEKIDNSNNYIISVPYQSVNTVFRAGQWRII